MSRDKSCEVGRSQGGRRPASLAAPFGVEIGRSLRGQDLAGRITYLWFTCVGFVSVTRLGTGSADYKIRVQRYKYELKTLHFLFY